MYLYCLWHREGQQGFPICALIHFCLFLWEVRLVLQGPMELDLVDMPILFGDPTHDQYLASTAVQKCSSVQQSVLSVVLMFLQRHFSDSFERSSVMSF